MASKKTARSKGKKLRKTKSRSQSAAFPCPNSGDPVSLNEIIDRMEEDPTFAEFIHGLLCESYTDENARKCLASYCKPTSAELTDLCIPKACQPNIMKTCTVPPPTGTTLNFLIALPAHRFAKKR